MSKAWTYTVTAGPDCPPVSLDDLKTHARVSGSGEDSLLNMILDAVTAYAEGFTKRDFITKTYQTFRDDFRQVGELRRSKLQSVTTIKYLVSGALVTVSDAIYYNTVENDFSEILLEEGESFPTDGDVRKQAIEIIFKAGFGDDPRSVPGDLKLAILQHATNYNENRGDCTLADSVPASAKIVYGKYRIIDVRLGDDRRVSRFPITA